MSEELNISLKHKSLLEGLLRKSWLYKGTQYLVSDFTVIGNMILISTDIKAIKISADAIEAFVKECLPVENSDNEIAIAKPGKNDLTIPGLDGSVISELTQGLMTSFREIQGAKGADEKFLKQAISRANAKTNLSKAITDIAKTAINAKRSLK